MEWLRRLSESGQARCDRENQNENWPNRHVGDGWVRRRDGALLKGGCVRPVAFAPASDPPPKPRR